MSVVARERLTERVELYAQNRPEATTAEVLGRFSIDPSEENEERQLVEAVLSGEIETDTAASAAEVVA